MDVSTFYQQGATGVPGLFFLPGRRTGAPGDESQGQSVKELHPSPDTPVFPHNGYM